MMETPVTEYDYTEYPAARRPRRRGPSLLYVLVALALVAGTIGVVADRVAARAATQQLRGQLVAELSNHDVHYDALDVAIGGFPFLTQVARGRYDEITIDMAGVTLPPLNGHKVRLPHLHVVATGVNADAQQLMDGTAKVNADQVTGTAVVSFATLGSLADASGLNLSEVSFAEKGGELTAAAKATVVGISVPLTATAAVSVVAGQFQVTLHNLTAVNVSAPPAVRNYLANLAEKTITAKLPPLPFGLTLDKVTVEPSGLAITATGHDVPLTS
jgi:hypothetical protein